MCIFCINFCFCLTNYAIHNMLDKATNIDVNVTIGSHKYLPVIWIQFEKNDALIQRVKKLTGVKFIASQKCRQISHSSQNKSTSVTYTNMH